MLGIAYQDPAFFFLFFLSSGQPIANRVIGHLSPQFSHHLSLMGAPVYTFQRLKTIKSGSL